MKFSDGWKKGDKMFKHTEKEIEDFLDTNYDDLILCIESAMYQSDEFSEYNDENFSLDIEYMGRQIEVCGKRLDMLFKIDVLTIDKTKTPEEEVCVASCAYIIELKKDMADISAYSQVITYSNMIKEIVGISTLVAIAAPSFSNDLTEIEMHDDKLSFFMVEKIFNVKNTSYHRTNEFFERHSDTEVKKLLR